MPGQLRAVPKTSSSFLLNLSAAQVSQDALPVPTPAAGQWVIAQLRERLKRGSRGAAGLGSRNFSPVRSPTPLASSGYAFSGEYPLRHEQQVRLSAALGRLGASHRDLVRWEAHGKPPHGNTGRTASDLRSGRFEAFLLRIAKALMMRPKPSPGSTPGDDDWGKTRLGMGGLLLCWKQVGSRKMTKPITHTTDPESIALHLEVRRKWRERKRRQREREKGITRFRETKHRLLRLVVEPEAATRL